MGGYLLFNIEFKTIKDRNKFEKLERFRRMFQYVDGTYDCTYYPVWDGYAYPQEVIQRCKKNRIKIIRFLSIDLSSQGSWYDEIKDEIYNEEEKTEPEKARGR